MHAKLSVSCSYTLKWLCWAVDEMLLQLLKLKGIYNLAEMSNIPTLDRGIDFLIFGEGF